MRDPRPHPVFDRYAISVILLASALLVPLGAVQGQSLAKRAKAARLELVVFGRPFQRDAASPMNDLLRRTGFGDSVYQGYLCGRACDLSGAQPRHDWYSYPRYLDPRYAEAFATPSVAVTLSAALLPHLRATAVWVDAAKLGVAVGGSCPNLLCYRELYGPSHFIGLDTRMSSAALLAEGEYGWLRAGVGPSLHGVTIQSHPWFDQGKPWRDRSRPVGALASVGLTVPLWRAGVLSGRWTHAVVGNVQVAAHDVPNSQGPLAPPRRFSGGEVDLSHSFVLIGAGLRLR